MQKNSKQRLWFCFFIYLFLVVFFPKKALALDTDIYQNTIKPNVAILFDTSGSMDFGVYEHTIDYGAYYNWASDLGDCDKIAGGCGTSNYFYPDSRKYPRNEILLIKGKIRVRVLSDGTTFTGDAGDPDYVWYTNDVIETNTCIDREGNLYACDGNEANRRITLDANGTILLDGEELPYDRSIKLHNWQKNPDGTMTDKGFGGLLNAPGWYFSGFEGIGNNASDHNLVEDGDQYIYFFIPGNWINMQMVYNLYTQDSTDEAYRTWKVRTYPNAEWHTVFVDNIESANYPANYPNNHSQSWDIEPADANQVRFHFVSFRTQKNHDFLKIYKNEIKPSNKIDSLSGNKGSDFWIGPYNMSGADKLILEFTSDGSKTKKGFKIDRYQYITNEEVTQGYKMQRRLDVVRDAILYVIEQTKGKINWALASFSTPTTGNGAKIWQPFDPSLSDEQLRQNITTYINQFEPYGGTPLGEALQDIFKHFEQKANVLPECAKNYVIVISDGYPSADNDWSRISGKTFTDEDGDGWTEDPYQYTYPPEDYFDDVARFMFSHSFRDRSIITHPEDSFDNIISHMLGFVLAAPIMQDAASDGGGLFLAAYNKMQLVNAFYALGLLIVKSSSYVAPVISVDTSNKTQSGEWLYMAFFKPKNERWAGNLKKYKLKKMVRTDCPGRREAEWVITDRNGHPAVDCQGNFYSTSSSFWSNESDGGEVEKGGAGSILKEALQNASLSDPYSFRKIYILENNGTITQFLPDNITYSKLGLTNDSEKYKLINYIYGYTYDEDGTSFHLPIERRAWPLGSFIHSSPAIITYENENKNLIVIGGNDGMLHVFSDIDGTEICSFIPGNLLTKLKDLPESSGVKNPLFFVDGQITQHFTFDDNGKIVPGTLIFGLRRGGRSYYALDISNPDPAQWQLKWYIDNTKPEFSELGQTWSRIQLTRLRASSSETKVVGIFGAGYEVEEDKENPGNDSFGRGLYIIDLDSVTNFTPELIKSFTYSSNTTSILNKMKYAIPADPTIIKNRHGKLRHIFFGDLGGQVWKISYAPDSDSASDDANWEIRLIFQANPGFTAASGDTGGSVNATDTGRKMFYSPTVTVVGNCGYYEDLNGNHHQDLDANETNRSFYNYFLFVGTGDREKPNSTSVHNRLYAFLDPPEGLTLNESYLFNATNDELDTNSTLMPSERDEMLQKLFSTYGWYIKLNEISDGSNHKGEKILSTPLLFSKVVYATGFTPVIDDPCRPQGLARIYALKYCTGVSAYNYNLLNDAGGNAAYDLTDRYMSVGESIPSPPKIIIRSGRAGGFVSVGNKLVGLGENGTSNIQQEPFNIKVIEWHEVIK